MSETKQPGEHSAFEPLADEFLRCAKHHDLAAQALSRWLNNPQPGPFASFMSWPDSDRLRLPVEVINMPLASLDLLIDRCRKQEPSALASLQEIREEVFASAKRLEELACQQPRPDTTTCFDIINGVLSFNARRLRRMVAMPAPVTFPSWWEDRHDSYIDEIGENGLLPIKKEDLFDHLKHTGISLETFAVDLRRMREAHYIKRPCKSGKNKGGRRGFILDDLGWERYRLRNPPDPSDC